jgi:hypothetical protein
MKDEITDFFGNLENITDFSISKWIRQQTNNLDPNEFCKLSSEFNKYYISREVEETNPPKNIDRLIKNDNDYFNSLSLNYYTIKNNTIQYNRIKFANKIDYDHFDLIRVFSSFQNIMHELFEIIKAKETTTTDKVDCLLKNPNQTIFKNDFAFTLFDKMKGFYNDASKEQANYSFLFDIMKKDGFVICTGKKFIDFLSKFNISMTKIDSNKTGNKDKAMLYNATKDNLEEKHKKSTV